MAEMQQWERRPRNGALIAIIGAGALMAGVFLPWVTGAGESVSGWDLYDLRREAGREPVRRGQDVQGHLRSLLHRRALPVRRRAARRDRGLDVLRHQAAAPEPLPRSAPASTSPGCSWPCSSSSWRP